MAERKSQSKVEQAQRRVDELDKVEKTPSALASPRNPEEPSSTRHWVYVALVMFGGLALNIILMALLGGAGGS